MPRIRIARPLDPTTNKVSKSGVLLAASSEPKLREKIAKHCKKAAQAATFECSRVDTGKSGVEVMEKLLERKFKNFKVDEKSVLECSAAGEVSKAKASKKADTEPRADKKEPPEGFRDSKLKPRDGAKTKKADAADDESE